MDIPTSYPRIAPSPTGIDYLAHQPAPHANPANTVATVSEDSVPSIQAESVAARHQTISSPAKGGTGILKGTGPELPAEEQHRPRPSISYNLKDLIDQTRAPSMQATDHGEAERQEHQLHALDTSQAEQPAKRQRLDNSSPSLPSSRDSVDAEYPEQTILNYRNPSTIPSHFNMELLKYLWPVLLEGGITQPVQLLSLDFYKSFIVLPKVRDIEDNPNSKRSKWTYRTKVDLIALLVQVTGKLAPKSCTKCDLQIGLWMGCIVTSSEAQRKSYYGCANCIYHGTQTYCSHKPVDQQKPKKNAVLGGVHTQTRPAAAFQYPGRQNNYPEVVTDVKSQTSGSIQNGTGFQSQENPWIMPVMATGPDPCARPVSTMPQRESGDSVIPHHERDATFTGAAAWTNDGAAADEAARLRDTPSMEKWERAPGRIRSRALGKPQNIAFSKSYLAHGSEVQVCREASFKVQVIRSGHSFSFEAESGVTRICSLATTGKLNIKMDGELPIVIGPHGMFAIRPHTWCIVESEVYDEVSLHITSVKTG